MYFTGTTYRNDNQHKQVYNNKMYRMPNGEIEKGQYVCKNILPNRFNPKEF